MALTNVTGLINITGLIKETDFGTPARVSETLVQLEIDGKPVSVPVGTSILRAAVDAGRKHSKALRYG